MLERHQYISIDRVTMEGNKQGISLLTILFIAAMTRTNKSGYPEILRLNTNRYPENN